MQAMNKEVPVKRTCKADFWTASGVAIESLTSFVSYSYSLASSIDSLIGIEPKIVGLSYIGLGTGIGFGLYFTISSAIAHYTLNTQHQDIDILKLPITERTGLVKSKSHDLLLIRDYVNGDLSVGQTFVFLGDFCAHGFDTASPLMLISTLAEPSGFAWWKKALVDSTAIAAGMFGAWAHVRTCKNALKNANVESDIEKNGNAYQTISEINEYTTDLRLSVSDDEEQRYKIN